MIGALGRRNRQRNQWSGGSVEYKHKRQKRASVGAYVRGAKAKGTDKKPMTKILKFAS